LPLWLVFRAARAAAADRAAMPGAKRIGTAIEAQERAIPTAMRI